jgi:hypothetical protein
MTPSDFYVKETRRFVNVWNSAFHVRISCMHPEKVRVGSDPREITIHKQSKARLFKDEHARLRDHRRG